MVSLAISAACFCCTTGCKGPDNIELLEARLRENEVTVQNYERELGTMNSKLAVAQREANILREQLKRQGKPIPAVEATTALAAVETLKFHTLLTAGQDKDSQPGDEKFHAIVSPYDANGEIVKVIGEVELEAVDLSLPEDQRTVGKWSFTPDEAMNLWHAGYLSTGYRFELPWATLPSGNEVVLRMTMQTPDGRELVASHTVKIQPPTELAKAEPTEKTAPNLINPPSEVRQASASKSGKAVVEQKKPERPEPVLDLFETPQESESDASEKSISNKITPISYERNKPLEFELPKTVDPRPFPNAIKTSDTQSEYTSTVIR